MRDVNLEQQRGQAVCINRHADDMSAKRPEDGECAGVGRRLDDDGVT
jgi:hypothetical protein